MKAKFIKISILSIALASFFVGCKKDSETTLDENSTNKVAGITEDKISENTGISDIDTDLIIDDLAIEAMFQDAQSISDNADKEDNEYNKEGLIRGCAKRTVSPNIEDSSITIKYEFNESECTDKKTRSGSFTVFVNRLRIRDFSKDSTIFRVTFNKYKVSSSAGNNYEISGIRTVTNKSNIDTTNGIHQNIVVTGLNGSGTNASIIKNDSLTIEWYSNRTRKQSVGQNTRFLYDDDVFEITGSHGGVSAKGTKYDVEVLTALVGQKCTDVAEIVTGTMNIKTDLLTYSLDFGKGDCDNKVAIGATGTITVAGNSQTINIPAEEVPMIKK